MSHVQPQAQPKTAEAARGLRRLGLGLSLIGVALALAALTIVLLGGYLLALREGGAALNGFLRWLSGLTMSGAPGVILLFAMVGLITGEQLRRGSMGANPRPPKTVLPTASNVSSFRIVGVGWRLVWIALGLVVSVVLVGVPVRSWLGDGWPPHLRERFDFTGYWLAYGAIAFAITVAAFVSLVKKQSYERAIRTGRAKAGVAGPGGAFWRWVDYRWRFDLWLGALGGLLIALGPNGLSDSVGQYRASDDFDAAVATASLLVVVGILLIVASLVAAAQFWRSGEALGSGESLS